MNAGTLYRVPDTLCGLSGDICMQSSFKEPKCNMITMLGSTTLDHLHYDSSANEYECPLAVLGVGSESEEMKEHPPCSNLSFRSRIGWLSSLEFPSGYVMVQLNPL